ncbi:GNAT family N-acetyltransferase [Exiguobacterium alkaliphilum]|uniref:GNAT family N-acetyltransferase n=1 Tax=Exiguobacterium alkaliphilum TaxID=1428684 RepID=UPI00346406DC
MENSIVLTLIENPIWDGELKRILESHPGALEIPGPHDIGISLEMPDVFWYEANEVSRANDIVGIGRIQKWDDSDYEISIALVASKIGSGHGRKVLTLLEKKAKDKGAKSVIVAIKPSNPNAEKVVKWFEDRGYNIDVINWEEVLKSKRRDIQLSKYV